MRPDRRQRLAAIAAVLTVAMGMRLWLLFTHTYVLFVDETFQYLEPAHRLAFGSGIVTWEYIDGIRSWLLPEIIAAVMRLAVWIDPSPATYVGVVRVGCVALSLVLPYVGFRVGERAGGLAGGVVVGLLGAVWYEALYFAPVVMTEPLAAHLALLGLWLGEQAPAARRRLVVAGALLGVTTVLRFQYAPALALAVLWQQRRTPTALGTMVLAGGATIGLLGGGLDALTWGMPFQSVWLNIERNAIQGVGAAMGAEPWWFPFGYFAAAWGPALPLLLGLAVLGARRFPALAIAALATLALHALTPHKEVRFFYLAIAATPMLIGLGAVRAGAWLRGPGLRHRRLQLAGAVAAAALLAGTEAATALTGATPPDAWHRYASTLHAFAAARVQPGLCGLGVRHGYVYTSGGYTYLHRDVPIYFEAFGQSQVLPGSAFRLRLRIVRDGRDVPQVPDAAFASAGRLFNVMVGRPQDALPGFAPAACFGAGTPDDERLCVFRRPGTCQPP